MNRLHATLPMVLKKHVWDLKYGLLGYPHFEAPVDALGFLSERMSESGSLLDLGCGRGFLIKGLRKNGWEGCYCGVDISKQAIRDAHAFGDQRSAWVVSDFESFASPFKWDTVAMIESMNYIKIQECPAVLARLMGTLRKQGIFITRFHDTEKYSEYIKLMYELYPRTVRIGPSLFCIAADAGAASS